MQSAHGIVFFSPGWPPSVAANGIATYVANLRAPLAECGFPSHVLTNAAFRSSINGATDVHALGQNDSLPLKLLTSVLHRVAPSRRPRFRWARQIVGALEHIGRVFPYDLFEIEETFGIARLIQRGVRVPVVVRLHGPWFVAGTALGVPEDDEFRTRVAREGEAIAAAVAVSSPSRDVLERVRKRYGIELPEAVVIPNPGPAVPVEHCWDRNGHEAAAILFVGRFDRLKGGDLIFDAFRRVALGNPRAELWFAGPDRGLSQETGAILSVAEFLDKHVPEGDVRRRIRVLGPQSQEAIATLRRRAAVTVVASRYENSPLTVVEALAFGTPLVASAVGGIPDMVRDGQTGLLFRAGDAGDLALKIRRLLEDSDLSCALAAAARSDYEARFAPGRVAAQMSEFYRRVVARGKPSLRLRERLQYPGISWRRAP